MIKERTQTLLTKASTISPGENIKVLKYSPGLIDELGAFVEQGIVFESVIVDATSFGFLFPTETLLDAFRFTRRITEPNGALLFITNQKAIAIQGDSVIGQPTFRLFENHSQLFDYLPMIAKAVRDLLGYSAEQIQGSADMTTEVLMTVVPVLTNQGIRLKGEIEAYSPRNAVLAAIDNFTSINAINESFSAQGRMSSEELLEHLKALEAEQAIYPVFPKVPMLVNCLRERVPFSLPDYLVAAQLVTRDELEGLLLEMRNNPNQEPITLGPLALKKGYINSRQLEITLQDQSFYGQDAEKEQLKMLKSSSEEAHVQSLLGHLASVDPSNLLQNLAQNRENGVLSVEYKDLQFRGLFEAGKLTHAKVGKIFGDQAVIEFASIWRAGIFVFMKRTPPVDLAKEQCRLTKQLDKLLLDAALATDNMDTHAKMLPNGLESILEKQEDVQGLFAARDFEDPQEKVKLSEVTIELMERLWQTLDGLSPLTAVIKRLADVPAYKVTRAAALLLHYQLVTVPQFGLQAPLEKFNQLVHKVSERLGVQRTNAFVRLGMRDSVGYSVKARMFVIGSGGEIGVNIAAARDTGTSLSSAIKDIENWQVKFIEYIGQELDNDTLVSIIREVHESSATT
jgi:hypothetical protein